MAKGDFKREFGGSRTAWEKGKRDAQSSFLNRIASALESIVKALTK